MNDLMGLENIYNEIKNSLDSGKDILLFAFNATGKTRLSREINNNEIIESFSYNAITEDYFYWDNESNTMFMLRDNELFHFIESEGLDRVISTNFNKFTDQKIEPIILFETGEIQFSIIEKTGERAFIKISKGEETLFKWSVYYTAIVRIIDILKEREEDRSNNGFKHLKYIVIDDPVSSIDDYRIYTLAMQIIELMQDIHENNLNIKFLITTHHSLFYNILQNTMKNRKDKSDFFFMTKQECEPKLESIGNRLPISYHIKCLQEIQKVLNEKLVKKIHFNMFRSVLEKTSIFLGYEKWQDLFEKYEDKANLYKIINMNSHERYVELETDYLTNEQLNILQDGFDFFVKKYNIKL